MSDDWIKQAQTQANMELARRIGELAMKYEEGNEFKEIGAEGLADYAFSQLEWGHLDPKDDINYLAAQVANSVGNP